MAKFQAPIIKRWDFMTVWSFKMQDLALQQHFPYKTSKFSENSNCRINLLFFIPGDSSLTISVFSMNSFHFWHSYNSKYKTSLGKIWSRDPSCKRTNNIFCWRNQSTSHVHARTFKELKKKQLKSQNCEISLYVK